MTSGPMPSVLVIDQDTSLRTRLREGIEGKGYRVIAASHGEEALTMCPSGGDMPGAIVLELEQPGITWYEVLEYFRKQQNIPILILASNVNEGKAVEALGKGADDFVVKPFGVEEICARIGAIFRRTGKLGNAFAVEPAAVFGNLTVNFYLREVRVGKTLVKLTPTEYNLLKYMIEHAGQVLPHRVLLTAIWGKEYADRVQYLRVYMGQLRKKIEKASNGQTFIYTDSGVGYRFVRE